LIIGLTGPNCAGKGEVAAILAGLGLPVFSLSDIVREQAAQRGMPPDRENLIAIGQELRRLEGPGVLAERLLPKLPQHAVVDSIRSPFEVQVLAARDDFRLVGVDAPREIRWKRALARGRIGDHVDFATFEEQEKRENQDREDSQQVGNTLAMADFMVYNEGELAELEARVRSILEAWI